MIAMPFELLGAAHLLTLFLILAACARMEVTSFSGRLLRAAITIFIRGLFSSFLAFRARKSQYRALNGHAFSPTVCLWSYAH